MTKFCLRTSQKETRREQNRAHIFFMSGFNNRSVKSRPIIELGRLAIADDDKLPGADLTSKGKKFDPLRQS